MRTYIPKKHRNKRDTYNRVLSVIRDYNNLKNDLYISAECGNKVYIAELHRKITAVEMAFMDLNVEQQQIIHEHIYNKKCYSAILTEIPEREKSHIVQNFINLVGKNLGEF